MMKEIMNIQETLAHARECGIPLTEYTLRRALKSGALPCRIVGRTYFISWTNVMRWLMCEDGARSFSRLQNPASAGFPCKIAHLSSGLPSFIITVGPI